jgi:DNA-binding MarR family transcriptional regulator
VTQNFFLNKLPERETNERIAADYPEMDLSAIETVMQFLLTSKNVSNAYTAFFNRYKLSDGKFAVLAVLDERPRQAFAPSALADRIGVSRAAVTGIIDGLEASNLVERTDDPSDRRMQVIQLTAQGHELLETLMPEHYQRTAKLMSGLTEVERVLMCALLEKIQRGLPALSAE